MSGQHLQAHVTEAPKVIDLHKIRGFDPDLGAAYGPEPITLEINDSTFSVPPKTRFVRYGWSDEELTVEYLDADTNWQRATKVDK